MHKKIEEFLNDVVNELATGKFNVDDNDLTFTNVVLMSKITISLKDFNCEICTVEYLDGGKKFMSLERVWNDYFSLSVSHSIVGGTMKKIFDEISRITWVKNSCDYYFES